MIVPPNRLSFGYIRKVSNNYFIGIELGTSIDKKNGRSNGNSEDYKLLAYRIQAGFIFNPESKIQNYVSVDFQQIHHTETLFDDYYRSDKLDELENKIYYDYDEINYKREKIAFNINYGFFAYFNKSKAFGINPTFGLGIKFVDVTYSNPVNLTISKRSDKIFNFGSRYRIEGKETNLNFNIQLKLFYKF